MEKTRCKCVFVVLSVLAALPIVLGMVHAKEINKQESSYMPVMVTESFEAVRKRDVAEKPQVMSKHMALLRERYDLSGKTDSEANHCQSGQLQG